MVCASCNHSFSWRSAAPVVRCNQIHFGQAYFTEDTGVLRRCLGTSCPGCTRGALTQLYAWRAVTAPVGVAAAATVGAFVGAAAVPLLAGGATVKGTKKMCETSKAAARAALQAHARRVKRQLDLEGARALAKQRDGVRLSAREERVASQYVHELVMEEMRKSQEEEDKVTKLLVLSSSDALSEQCIQVVNSLSHRGDLPLIRSDLHHPPPRLSFQGSDNDDSPSSVLQLDLMLGRNTGMRLRLSAPRIQGAWHYRRWLPLFSEYKTLIYTLSLADYDVPASDGELGSCELRSKGEAPPVTKLDLAVQSFRSLVNSRWFPRDMSIIVWLSGKDQFEDKLETSPYICGDSFTGPNDVDSCCDHIKQRLLTALPKRLRNIVFFCVRLDDERNMSFVCRAMTAKIFEDEMVGRLQGLY